MKNLIRLLALGIAILGNAWFISEMITTRRSLPASEKAPANISGEGNDARPHAKLEAGTPTGPKVQINAKKKTIVSDYIYGINPMGAPGRCWNQDSGFSLFRLGGNRLSAYNWTNNLSHAGSDYQYQNDDWLCGSAAFQRETKNCSKVGAVYQTFIDQALGISSCKLQGAALITIPTIGYVAKKSSQGDVCAKEHLAKDNVCTSNAHLAQYFIPSRAAKKAAFSLSPSASAPYVYQDEAVNWIMRHYAGVKDSDKRIFFALDNEPGLWASTHARLRPVGNPCATNPTYKEVLERNIEYAAAIKKVAPQALVFGPVSYGWYELAEMQGTSACDGLKGHNFTDYYLKGLAQAARDRKLAHLVDVLDFHWYSEARGKSRIVDAGATDPASIRARLDAPRSLWDPDYIENSWISESLGGRPIQLLPRLKEKIAKYNSGMRLAITEYNHGGENHISGALAQADTLGIFAREQVFAASYWALQQDKEYIFAAFKAFRNYDGKGSRFGSTLVEALSSAPQTLSTYASLTHDDSLVVIAINKDQNQRSISLMWEGLAKKVKTHRSFLLDGSAPKLKESKLFTMVSDTAGVLVMPATSLVVLEFKP